MKFKIHYTPPYKGPLYPTEYDINKDWRVSAMVVYRDKSQKFAEPYPPNACVSLFFPPNPWDALEKV
mgnify:CR=1 FL=1